MNSDVFNSIDELKKVFRESQNFRFFIITRDFDEKAIDISKLDRDKMVDILNQFYKSHNKSAEEIDDFITLFGVYCNYYVLYGLHLILKEDNLGTNGILENISDDSLRSYLSLIQLGISTQDMNIFRKAVEVNKTYSLAHFYLFLSCLREYYQFSYQPSSDEEKNLRKELIEHYRAIRNEELKKYMTGLSVDVLRLSNYAIKLLNSYLLIDHGNKDKIIDIMNNLFKDLNNHLSADQKESANMMTLIDDELLDLPPLPCPYLMTSEEKQRMSYIGVIQALLLVSLGESSIIAGLYDKSEKFKNSVGNKMSEFMMERSRFLQIPYEIEWTSQELYHFVEHIEVEQEKETIVKDFMHTYSNMRAEDLYRIAELLLKRNDPEEKKNGRILMMEYTVKAEISNSVHAMQLMYGKDSAELLKKNIFESIVDEKDDHEDIADILNKSLRQCLINIFYASKRLNEENRIAKMRKNLTDVWDEDFLESKTDKFERQVMEQNLNCLMWLLQEGINFTFTQDYTWSRIFMAKDSYCSAFFKTLFDELCVNVFKYGDFEKEIRLDLFKSKNGDLAISFENHIPTPRAKSNTRIGIDLLRRKVQVLHEDVKKNCVGVVDAGAGKIFRIRLTLPSALFLNQVL